MKGMLCVCALALSFSVFAHDEAGAALNGALEESSVMHQWVEWIGSFHLIFLHFPIALINLLAVAEVLNIRHPRPLFEHASRFLLVAAAIVSLPTALLGIIYSYAGTYNGTMEWLLMAHMFLGITVAVLAVVMAMMRENSGTSRLYYGCLLVLFLLINATGYLGGEMMFGINHMMPPV